MLINLLLNKIFAPIVLSFVHGDSIYAVPEYEGAGTENYFETIGLLVEQDLKLERNITRLWYCKMRSLTRQRKFISFYPQSNIMLSSLILIGIAVIASGPAAPNPSPQLVVPGPLSPRSPGASPSPPTP